MSKATIPVKVLYEAVPHIVSVEMKNGEAYRGKLTSIEENMNCLVEGVTKTHKDGRTTTLEQVYLRGSHIRLFQLPDLIKHARVLKQGNPAAPAGRGKGRNIKEATRK